MTDTGQVPAEGLPENAGMVEQPSVPAHGAYTYHSETTAEDEDLLLLPGAQGAWGNEVPPPVPEPVVETVQESVPLEPAVYEPGPHDSVPHGQGSHETAPHEPGPHETAGRDSGSVDLGAVRLAEPPPAPVTPRRPLHLGPPLPDTSASPVRSLADRGPAGAPVRQTGRPTTGPEYLDTPQLRDLPPQGAAPWGAQAPAGAAVRTAETVAPAPAPEPGPESGGAAQAAVARLATEAVNGAVATAPDAGEAWQGHGQLYAAEAVAPAAVSVSVPSASSASSASSVHASTESSGTAGVPETGQLPEGAEELGAGQIQDGTGFVNGHDQGVEAGVAYDAGQVAQVVGAHDAEGLGAETLPGHGAGVDAEAEFPHGDGPAVGPEAVYGDGPGAEAPLLHGVGPETEGAVVHGDGPGIEAPVVHGDGDSDGSGPEAVVVMHSDGSGSEAVLPLPHLAGSALDAVIAHGGTPVSDAAPAQVDDAPVSDGASVQTTDQAPEGAFVASQAPAPEDVAVAEPSQAQGVAFAPDADQVPDVAQVQETADEAQEAEATPPVPTGVETPIIPEAEPLAIAVDPAQPAPTADDPAPLAEAEAVPTPVPDAAYPDGAVTPAEVVPAPLAEGSPVLLDAAPGDPAFQPTAAPEAVAEPEQQFTVEAEPVLAPQPIVAEGHGAEGTPLAQPTTPDAEFVEFAEVPQAVPAGADPDDSLGRFVPVEGSVPTTPHLAPTPPHPLVVPTEEPTGGPESFATVPGPREADADGEPELVQHADDLDTRAADQEEESTAAVEDVRESTGPAAPAYDDAEREAVLKVMRERRDIRNGFRSDPIPHDVLLRVLEAAHTAPSVGHSQPWDFVVIRSADTRRNMHELAQSQREAYAKSLPKGRAKQFKELKIEAILDTPVNIVVTADPTRGGRHTLGRHTQPQMAPYSAALAVENLWLAARAEGLGVGWVSFFDEREMVRALGLPEHLEVIAYLCVGYVDEFPDEPELMQAGWSKRRPLSWVVHEETYGRRALPGEDPHDLLAETVAGIRPLDAKALGEAWERQKRMTKPPGSLGMLEIISAQLSGLSRQCPPPIPEPAAVAIFAGDHGVHAQGVTPWPQEVTAQMVANFLGGGAVCNAFASQVGAEVCVVDVGVASELPATPGLLPRKIRAGTSDMTTGPAMTREEAKQAIEVGIETARDLVAAGNKALLTGEMGIANTTASAALISVFTDTDPADVTGRGTGINDETLARKTEVVRRAIELHQPDPADPIGVLAAIGGFEHAAMVGLLLGGASLRTPVILDGVSAGAAALVARAIAPEVLAACIAGHRSAEPGHVAALNKLGLRPLVDLDLRLGEGTGALLALPLVQSTARAMHEVATFDSAGVTEK
ncbi:nicotinate-nucleotide--dimethylbenzimidazole phosphoribosyltransferase [Streptomyces sp. MBT53]|uniref:nicotinate-nucleotide--dimethylbenzimidazole phosphoribosyltransferase n=1 Tax=Streptomyces sp. MBT53 TaxID=1488384 RepID=UPI001911A57D|nr:nicotinate-nucleotide--dimethylbenzimidazole phosphoribosyltransferase [Streptomyces sp. MBT53]MBK6016955.1 nicotinate-nucleotide--dimethylbenzimidazole phosphoribosyltransferase [Streptomyces sp. MBT53]